MYPPIEPYETGNLQVSDIHTLYYEISGNKEGTPVVFFHGGPGGGSRPQDRCFFSPEKYKIVIFDQRGCGKSTPPFCIEQNTTWDLVEDVEKLREKLGIDKWHVFGGSWGSTLALVYAQAQPQRVKSLVLRGIFTGTKSETDYFLQDGAQKEFPEAWGEFIALVPEEKRGDNVLAYHELLNSTDQQTQLKAAKAWVGLEMAGANLPPGSEVAARFEDPKYVLALARIENYYFVNGAFLRDGQIMEKEEIDKIRHIPAIAVHGENDMLCPVSTAYDLKKAWPELDLQVIPNAGHASGDPGISKALIAATDKFSEL